MSNKCLLALFLVFGILMNAQYEKGVVVLKDSTKIEGLIKLRITEGIEFKKYEDDKPVIYTSENMLGFDKDGEQFRYVLLNGSNQPKLLNLYVSGKVTFYGIYTPSGKGMHSFGPQSNLAPVEIDRPSRTVYFMLKDGKLTRIGTKLKKKHLKLLKDCALLIEKINNGKICKKSIAIAIEFYNDNYSVKN